MAPEAEDLFDGYLRLRRIEGARGPVELLSGPGHDVVVVTCFVRTQDGFRFVIKRGDTRPARALVGRPYVLRGLVAGRLDHEGQPPEAIARAEVEEEIGGRVVGEVVELGALPVPTMPIASTEADLHLLAEVELGGRPRGDGGGMEVPELLGHELRAPQEVLRLIRAGALGEACRARVAFGRAMAHLGPLDDAAPRARPPADGPSAPSVSPEAIDGARVDVVRAIPLRTLPGRFLDARATHLAGAEPVGAPFPTQILDLELEEAEVLPVARDDEGRAWVGLERLDHPALELKLELQAEVRSGRKTPSRTWAGAVTRCARGGAPEAASALARERGWDSPRRLLGSEASPGQSTFRETVWAASAPLDETRMLPLAAAFAQAREEGVTARTEAGLLELLAGRA